MRRSAIELLELPGGVRTARLNPVETEVIHLFVQLSSALGHPCKIYNVVTISAPVIYIGPTPSHVTEILNTIGETHPQACVEHGEADKLAKEIRRLAGAAAGKRSILPRTALAEFSKKTLLPKMIAVVEGGLSTGV